MRKIDKTLHELLLGKAAVVTTAYTWFAVSAGYPDLRIGRETFENEKIEDIKHTYVFIRTHSFVL